VEKEKMVIGGQALIEGIMMRSKNFYAIALRRKSGVIDLKIEKCSSFSKKYRIFAKPFIRGIVALIESIIIGMKTLSYSADIYTFDHGEEEQKIKAENDISVNKKIEDKHQNFQNANKKTFSAEIIFSICFSIIFGILLFVMVPLWLTNLIKMKLEITNFGFNIIDGLIRLLIFLGYVVIISLLKDIRRVFEYHGAEHKVVFLYENSEALVTENAYKYSTLHPRCGTNFMFIVIVISIVLFSIFKVDTFYMKFLIRILALPIIAGVSYEILRFLGKRSKNKILKIFLYPGLFLQKLTTREPDKKQLEVGIAAINAVIEKEKELYGITINI
jgi:uncharacterized protein YqhQ